MARNSTERLVAILSRDNPMFPYIVNTVNPPFVPCKCGVMLILKGWCLIDPLYCCTAGTGVTYIGSSFSSRPVLLYVQGLWT